jgi:hypothetical protein
LRKKPKPVSKIHFPCELNLEKFARARFHGPSAFTKSVEERVRLKKGLSWEEKRGAVAPPQPPLFRATPSDRRRWRVLCSPRSTDSPSRSLWPSSRWPTVTRRGVG